MPRRPRVPRRLARAAAILGPIAPPVLGWTLAWTGACANSDQVIERRRRLEAPTDATHRCYSGVTEDCYSGPDGTAGRGACRLGTRTCEGGRWGACVGEAVPTQELCNRVDDDCDGIVDNDFERDGALCFFASAKGVCRTQGRWHCSEDGTSSECDAPRVLPSPERCDALDNDCDGEIDEDAVEAAELACSTGKLGACEPGTRKCVYGQIRCVQNIQPGAEICNGRDDNCNGRVDDDCVR